MGKSGAGKSPVLSLISGLDVSHRRNGLSPGTWHTAVRQGWIPGQEHRHYFSGLQPADQRYGTRKYRPVHEHRSYKDSNLKQSALELLSRVGIVRRPKSGKYKTFRWRAATGGDCPSHCSQSGYYHRRWANRQFGLRYRGVMILCIWLSIIIFFLCSNSFPFE